MARPQHPSGTARSTVAPAAKRRTSTPEAPRPLPPRAVVSTKSLAALAVPVRLALLNHLLAAGPRTASQCAAIVGETASNCSWHLRALAKVGLVERAAGSSTDSRNRPWQAAAVGFEFADDDGPGVDVIRDAFNAIATDHETTLFRRYRSQRDSLPERWTKVEHSSAFSLQLTPEELGRLLDELDALIRPYVRPIRTDAPAGSSVVHMHVQAFLDPDVHRSDPTTATAVEPHER